MILQSPPSGHCVWLYLCFSITAAIPYPDSGMVPKKACHVTRWHLHLWLIWAGLGNAPWQLCVLHGLDRSWFCSPRIPWNVQLPIRAHSGSRSDWPIWELWWHCTECHDRRLPGQSRQASVLWHLCEGKRCQEHGGRYTWVCFKMFRLYAILKFLPQVAAIVGSGMTPHTLLCVLIASTNWQKYTVDYHCSIVTWLQCHFLILFYHCLLNQILCKTSFFVMIIIMFILTSNACDDSVSKHSTLWFNT